MSDNYFETRKFCPACKSTHTQELFSAGFTEPPISSYLNDFYALQGGVQMEYLQNSAYVLDECKVCGLIYQRYIPNDFLMIKLYEHWIDPKKIFSLDRNGRGISYYVKLAREIELTIRHFERRPSELTYLDFGMGWGEWCHLAKAYGCNVFGAELSDARIEHAKALGISVITWDDISGHQFDFINTEQVFEHIADPFETLGYLSNSLKPHGLIKINVPNGWDIRRRLAIMDWTASKGSGNSLNIIAPLEHINCFNHDVLLRMARKADLMPVHIKARISPDKTILDFTVRDILRPYYDWFIKMRSRLSGGSTYILFQRKSG